MTTPIPFVDHDTWRTAVTYRGETAWFAGRVPPGHVVPLSPDGITEIREERLGFKTRRGVRFITCDFAEIEERCAAFAASLSLPMNKPLLSPRTEYTVHFDAPSVGKPAKYVGTSITPAEALVNEPGAYAIYDGERLVAELRFVSRIETAAIPPTVAELQAHIEALGKAHAEEVAALRASRDKHKAINLGRAYRLDQGQIEACVVRGIKLERDAAKSKLTRVLTAFSSDLDTIEDQTAAGFGGRANALIAIRDKVRFIKRSLSEVARSS